MTTALLVIDMQNDFIEEGALLEVKGIRNNIPKLNSFIDTCREKGIKIIFTRHIFSPENNPIESNLFPELSKDGLRDNTPGSEIFSEIKIKEDDIVIKKTRYDAFYCTELEKILHKLNVDNLIITGTMTNVCCESTARSAMIRDFKIQFCEDLTFTSDDSLQNATLKNISTHFGKVIDSKNFS